MNNHQRLTTSEVIFSDGFNQTIWIELIFTGDFYQIPRFLAPRRSGTWVSGNTGRSWQPFRLAKPWKPCTKGFHDLDQIFHDVLLYLIWP